MPNIIIDEEFKSLLPALSKETRASLEANLIENGCRDALVLWNGILIDGHNRYAICTEHNIPFNTVSKEFDSREEALIWIISTQVSRRNLTAIQLSYYRGIHYRADKKIVSNADGRNQYSEVESQNETQPKNKSTATRLADKYNVSRNTILRDLKIAEAIDTIGETSQSAKQKILAKEANIDKKVLEELSGKSTDELEALAAEIENNTYEKNKSGSAASRSPESPVGAESINMRPLDIAINKMSADIHAKLPKLMENGGGEELKALLRLYIGRLEDFFMQIESYK